jgi:hypothetical protein
MKTVFGMDGDVKRVGELGVFRLCGAKRIRSG